VELLGYSGYSSEGKFCILKIYLTVKFSSSMFVIDSFAWYTTYVQPISFTTAAQGSRRGTCGTRFMDEEAQWKQGHSGHKSVLDINFLKKIKTCNHHIIS
jgi:hypothetical protein